MKRLAILATLISTSAFGAGISVMQDGTIHCRGCRFKTIDGVQYVCTGSLANERCTRRDKWIKDVKAPKQMNNEDMSYLRESAERAAINQDVPNICWKKKWSWTRMWFVEVAVECD